MIWKHKKTAREEICVPLLCKSKSAEVLECANERHRNDLKKIWRHDDSKTISWHAAFPVRFARLLAALRLNSPLRGSDSGSLGRQHRKPHDGSLATVRAICFRIHHGCIILRTMFYNAVRLYIAKSSWLAGGRLSGTVLSGQKTEHEKTEVK